MFDEDGELHTPYQHEDNTEGSTSRKRFVLSLGASIVFVAFFLFIIVSASNIGALTFGGVGGIYTEIDVLIGNELAAYPYPTETAACEANFDNPTVGNTSEQAVTALRADVEQLIVPANSNLRLSKDIRVPEISGMDNIRISLERTGVETNPTYPPQAPTGPLSDGENPGALVDRVNFGGIFVRTGSNDGYSDLRFQRTRNITDGESVPFKFTVESNYRYGDEVNALDYPAANGLNGFRYIDDVVLQGLDNNQTGDNGGYADYTQLSNSFDGATAPDGNLTRGTGIGIEVNAVGAAPDYSQPIPPNAPSGTDTRATINDVNFEGISNTGTDDTGYNDFTAQSTNRLGKGNQVTIDVSGNKIGGPSDYFEETPPGCSVGGAGNDFAIDSLNVYQNSPDPAPFDTSGTDGCRDYTSYSNFGGLQEPTGVVPGSTFEVAATITANGNANDGKYNPLPPVPGITIGKVFVDWNGDGTFEEDYVLGTAVSDEEVGYSRTQVDASVNIPVPDDAQPGTTTMRIRTDGSRADDEAAAPDLDYGPNEVTGDGGESQDYTLHITQRSQVSAFFDWNQDGSLEQEVELFDSIGKNAGYNEQVTFTVPPDAKSGSSRMRIVHRNGLEEVTPSVLDGQYTGETHDYTVEVADQNTNAAVWAFVDWDQDGDFDRAEEEQKIDDEDAPTGPWTALGTVTAPDYALAGPTLMRVVHQQDGYNVNNLNYPEPGPDEELIEGEYEDYTVNVEPSASFARVWVDWNGDGNPTLEIDKGPVGEGDDQTRIQFNGTLDAPNPVDPGYRLLRVTHKQGPAAATSPPTFAEGTDFQGESLDFTVVTGPPGDVSNDGNVTLGDVSFIATGLDAEELDLRGNVLIEESYTNNTLEDPKFGRDGEFILRGDDARLTNVRAVTHSVFFSFFDLPGLRVSIEYDPNNPRTAANACNVYP